MATLRKEDALLGPAMLALNPRQRAFVFAMVELGGSPLDRAAAMAGYNGSPATLSVTGTRLAHDAKVQEAMVEEARRRLHSSVILAASELHKMLADPTTSASHRLRAMEMVFNRAGLPSNQEHTVKHEYTPTEQEQVKQVATLAKQLGLDPQRLLGNMGITVDADFTIVNDIEEWAKDE